MASPAACSTPTSAMSVRATTFPRAPAAAPLDSTPTSVLSSSTATPTYESCRPLYQDDLTPEARRIYHFLVSGSARTTPTASPCVSYSVVSTSGSLDPEFESGTPETDLHSMNPSTCSKKCREGDMSVTLAPSSPAAVHTSSALPATVLATANVPMVLQVPTEIAVIYDEVEIGAPT
jgi:hypothetical protein